MGFNFCRLKLKCIAQSRVVAVAVAVAVAFLLLLLCITIIIDFIVMTLAMLVEEVVVLGAVIFILTGAVTSENQFNVSSATELCPQLLIYMHQ